MGLENFSSDRGISLRTESVPDPGTYAQEQKVAALALQAQGLDPYPSITDVQQSDPNPKTWEDLAACFGLNTQDFFPTSSPGVDSAKQICNQCPVRQECLEFALVNRIAHGIWGGASERERQRILRKRRETRTSGNQG